MRVTLLLFISLSFLNNSTGSPLISPTTPLGFRLLKNTLILFSSPTEDGIVTVFPSISPLYFSRSSFL